MSRATDARPGITFIIPAYNEEHGLATVLRDLDSTLASTGLEYEVLVVDDGSVDATAQVDLGANTRLIRHPMNVGYGASLKTGLRQARYDVIGITDADGTYPTSKVPEMIERILEEGCDMVVGARTLGNVAIPRVRRPAKWILNRLADFVTGVSIPDINSGLRVFRRDVALQFYSLFPQGFSFTTTLTLAMESNGYLVAYVPIEYHARIGSSKIRPIHDTLMFSQLILRLALYFSPLRIFLPLAGGLMFLGVAWGCFTSFVLGKLADTSTLVIIMAGFQVAVVGLLAEIINHRLPASYRPEREV